jgi:predicted metal-dependent enzyme (double-stranded beta helix superfamily)
MPQATQMRRRKAIHSWSASIGADRAPGFAVEKDPEPHAAGKI